MQPPSCHTVTAVKIVARVVIITTSKYMRSATTSCASRAIDDAQSVIHDQTAAMTHDAGALAPREPYARERCVCVHVPSPGRMWRRSSHDERHTLMSLILARASRRYSLAR